MTATKLPDVVPSYDEIAETCREHMGYGESPEELLERTGGSASSAELAEAYRRHGGHIEWYELPAEDLLERGDELLSEAEQLIAHGRERGDRDMMLDGLTRHDAARQLFAHYISQFDAERSRVYTDEIMDRLDGQHTPASEVLSVLEKSCRATTEAILTEHELGYQPTDTMQDGRLSTVGSLVTFGAQGTLRRAMSELSLREVPEELVSAFEQLCDAHETVSGISEPLMRKLWRNNGVNLEVEAWLRELVSGDRTDPESD